MHPSVLTFLFFYVSEMVLKTKKIQGAKAVKGESSGWEWALRGRKKNVFEINHELKSL